MKLLMIWMLGVPAVVAVMLLAFFAGAPHTARAQGKSAQASVQHHAHDVRSAIRD